MKARRLPISSSAIRHDEASSSAAASPRSTPPGNAAAASRNPALEGVDANPEHQRDPGVASESSFVTSKSRIHRSLPLSNQRAYSHSTQDVSDTREGDAQDSPSGHDATSGSDFPATEAVMDGRLVRVRIRVQSPHQPQELRDSIVGLDGNKFYCQVCAGFGEIVCCDGCPRVFHPDCIAPNHPSRLAHDRDEDPWYCPECLENPETLPSSAKLDALRSEIGKTWSPRLERGSIISRERNEGNNFVQSSDVFDEALFSRTPPNNGPSLPSSSLRKRPMNDVPVVESAKKNKSKHKKSTSSSPFQPTASPYALSSPATRLTTDSEDVHDAKPDPGLAHATPAFYFYLTENRWKIERVLARNHRFFNRLPKGEARNALVAKEAALWWTKLRPVDQRRYMNMSMRDFENQIIEWKEDKNLQGMGIEEQVDAFDATEETADDAKLKAEKHERLFLSTSVGSKPFTPEPDQSYNRVLLDLLHDARFHPLPLFSVTRSESDSFWDEHQNKVTIPYYEVHGPISTSVGDECLGCSRGWLHFCPVLKRRVPAVEHRAKLQPPLSSLCASRVGLGLQTQFESPDPAPDSELFEWRSSNEMIELSRLPVFPSSALDHASERVDDIARFIEETMAMKVPEPERPAGASGTALGASAQDDDATVYKCGRCRTIIYNDTGCVQCRRAQLVINTTKRTANGHGRGGRSYGEPIRTVMLGRVTVKDGMEEKQNEGDAAVSNAMLRVRWAPNAILPHEHSIVPMPKDGNDIDPADDQSTQYSLESSEGSTGHAPLAAIPEVETVNRRSQRAAALPSPGALDREQLARENRKKCDELQKKTLNIACCAILLAVRRRDPLLLFAEPATAEGYSAVVKKPIDLGRIRQDVLREKYTSLGSFVSDLKLLCDNALAFNPPGSIYARTAEQLHKAITSMHKRASDWVNAVSNAYSGFLFRQEVPKLRGGGANDASQSEPLDPFESLRLVWPQAVEFLDHGDWLREQLQSDFIRTRENELAYYGSIAVRRVATAAEASLAPYPDSTGAHCPVPLRTAENDEALRHEVDKRIALLTSPLQLKDVSTWREEAVVRLLRKVQSRRLDRKNASENGCSRCDSVKPPVKSSEVEHAHLGKGKRKGEGDAPRVDATRMSLTTGMGSAKIVARVEDRQGDRPDLYIANACTSVRGSKIHGWGLFAEQKFKKGDFVAEYVGEYVTNAVADAREAVYQARRIQDYQFRVDEKLVIDATLNGGNGRYINHNCSPNCISKIVLGDSEDGGVESKRVLFVALRDIDINEEITYDYQFPLEMNLKNRIPCNCQSDDCRGFMNWDIPEKGSNRALLIQKRGANIRDRIRRLGRPLKRDEGMNE